MRPYLGILKDSFREALASRVLWILLALTTLFLVALAPLGLADKKPTRLRRNTITRWNELAARLVEQGQGESPSPGRQVWSRLPADLQKTLAERNPEADQQFPFDLALQILNGLNTAITDRGFYDAAAWREADLTEESRTLRDKGVDALNADELARFNRLLLEAGFPAEIPKSTSAEIVVTYLGWPLGSGLPLTRTQITPILKLVVSGIVNFLVGTLGVFCAILVTASIIPQTFEPGSIDLLLSKPVSRSLVFLTKFFGGGVFIGLIALYLIAGLWLIAGLRFDLWMPRLWWCVPVFLFLFGVYYSVCALAGLLWRNTIVAIVLTIVFWGMCFTVGLAKNLVEQIWLTPGRLTQVTSAGEARFAVTEQGQFREWQPRDRTWEESFLPAGEKSPQPPFPMMQQILGPLYDSRHDRLLALQLPPSQGRGGLRLFGPSPSLLYAESGDGWLRKEGPNPPAGARALFLDASGRPVVVATDGVFRLDVAEGQAPSKKSGKFVFQGPQPRLKLDNESSAARDPVTGRIVTWSGGQLTVLEADDDGKYSLGAQQQVEEEGKEKDAVCAAASDCVLLALDDGRVIVYEAKTLTQRHEFKPASSNAPRFAATSPDGRWISVLFHNRQLWLYDTRERRGVFPRVLGQGDISAAAFDGPDRLLSVDRGTRVTAWKLDPLTREQSDAPQLTTVEMVYHYAIRPLYTIFPKPGELDNVISWLLTDQESVAIGGPPGTQNLQQTRVKLDVWGPIWSSTAFVVVVLGLTCLHVSRKDF